jgi:predicted nucleic acid-binding Zn ribbon protein
MRETLPQKHCLQCNKLFTPYRPKTKFCGNSCRVQNFWKRKSERSEKEINDLKARIKELEAQLAEKSMVKKAPTPKRERAKSKASTS